MAYLKGMNGRDIHEDEKRMRKLGHRRQIRCQIHRGISGTIPAHDEMYHREIWSFWIGL